MTAEMNQSHCYHSYREELHDGIAKTKYRFYMVPINAKFITYITLQDKYNANIIQSNVLALPTHPTHIYE